MTKDYTNPSLPVNPSAMEGTMQTMGPDGKKKEPESNVLLASIENLQYAVTVDVINTVFSAFGTVQKIAIFDKNGGMQALVQYPDVTTAAVAKEALEGHCIYDGGFCKLHLSYSRHTDLNVKAHTDRSRDYTIQDGLLAMQQPSPVPTAPGAWQNPQATSMYPGNDYAGHAQPSNGQMPWNPNMQATRPPSYVSAPATYPSQAYAPPSNYPQYSSSQPANYTLQQGPQPPNGQPPYYGQ